LFASFLRAAIFVYPLKKLIAARTQKKMGSYGRAFYLVLLFLTAAALTGTVVFIAGGGGSEKAGACTLSMFGNRTGAYWACRVQAALQQNWFPDPIQVYYRVENEITLF
jgi:hypothetical protein